MLVEGPVEILTGDGVTHTGSLEQDREQPRTHPVGAATAVSVSTFPLGANGYSAVPDVPRRAASR